MTSFQSKDTAGQERFRVVTRGYYRDANGILLVYDISQRNTFENLGSWVSQIKENANEDVAIVVVGNKADVDPRNRQVTFEEGRRFAETIEAQFFEVSAKEGNNVEQSFITLARDIKRRYTPQDLSAIDLSDNTNQKCQC